jgi:hypothetical protein
VKQRHKVIVLNNLIYEARTVEPDEAAHIARSNGMLTPEAFTHRYSGHVLELDDKGLVCRDLTDELRRYRNGEIPPQH